VKAALSRLCPDVRRAKNPSFSTILDAARALTDEAPVYWVWTGWTIEQTLDTMLLLT
jgi:hypothetical protein